jgi:hypothetical protein
MPSVPPTSLNWPNIKDQLLTLTETPEWTLAERALVRKFVDQATRVDLVGVVHRYMELVRDLGAPTHMSGALTLAEGGRLIDHVDPTAYIGVAPGEVLDPVEFVQRRQGNARARKRLESWVRDIPLYMLAIKSQIVQIPSATVFDFPRLLLKFVKEADSFMEVPEELRDVCDGIRLGRTSIARVSNPGLNAFFWPMLTGDFRDLLDSKEAVAFLRTLGKGVSPRTLRERAKRRKSLKQGMKYVRNELQKGATEGFFDFGQ